MSTDEPCITSIDCKILQYKYAIYKVKSLIPFLQQLQRTCNVKEGDTEAKEGDNKESKEEAKEAKEAKEETREEAREETREETKKEGDKELKPENSESKDRRTKDLILCHYLTILTGNVFAINEGLFSNKLDLINNYKLFKVSPINISPIVSHIPYDTNDPTVTPLEKVPDINHSVKVCKLLENLLHNCLLGYEKRLVQAQNDVKNQHEYDDDKFNSLIQEMFNKKGEIDIGSGNPDFKFPLELDSLQDLVYNEASLIDIDMKMLFVIILNFKHTLNHLKSLIAKYMKIKQQPVRNQQIYLQKHIPNWKYSLHLMFLLTLRLNDLYLILRRFIRKIYLSNFNHLNDPKFLSINNHQSNQTGHSVNYFRMLLRRIDDNFNNSKKNGVLIANLTRFIRQNSKFVNNPKNILDFINFISQGHQLLMTQMSTLQEFGSHWILFELYFRYYHKLPATQLQYIAENMNLNDASSIEDETNPAPGTKDHLEKPTVNRPSRSSSVSSNNSNNSNSNLPPHDPFLTRKSSINKRNSMMGSSPRQQRPNSMIFLNSNQNNSSNSLPTKQPSQANPLNNHLDPNALSPSTSGQNQNQNVNTTPTGRRRSNSQPQTSPDHYYTPNSSPVGIAASGAAAALKHNSNGEASLRRLPSNSRPRSSRPNNVASSSNSNSSSMRSNSLSSSTSINSPNASTTAKGSPVANKVQPIIEEDNHIKDAKKQSANQRLQNHLRQAAKSGSLMTQEREILTSVVFDPNSPSAVNLRRYQEKEISPPSIEVSSDSKHGNKNTSGNGNGNNANGPTGGSGVATAPLRRKTRDQVTKLNTKRNSELVHVVSTNDSNGSSASTRTGNIEPNIERNFQENNGRWEESQTAVIKKVRFTGVPEYTEAEDAPTKYANRILKNFAVFKTPRPGFKRKDQMLKKEESLSFKSQLHQNQQHSIIPGQGQNFQLPATAQEQAQAYVQAQQQAKQPNSPFLSNPLQTTKMKLKTRLS